MKHLRKFNEEISDDLKPKGFRTVERPTEEDLAKAPAHLKSSRKVDSYFIQEISDRLYGPDSEEYMKAITELNKNFRPRGGRFGSQFSDQKD
jgi:hypothetical protein